MHKADFAKKYGGSRDILNGLDSSKFSEILYSNTTPAKIWNPFRVYLGGILCHCNCKVLS